MIDKSKTKLVYFRWIKNPLFYNTDPWLCRKY